MKTDCVFKVNNFIKRAIRFEFIHIKKLTSNYVFKQTIIIGKSLLTNRKLIKTFILWTFKNSVPPNKQRASPMSTAPCLSWWERSPQSPSILISGSATCEESITKIFHISSKKSFFTCIHLSKILSEVIYVIAKKSISRLMKSNNWAGANSKSWFSFTSTTLQCLQFKFPTCWGYIIPIKVEDKFPRNHFVHKCMMKLCSCKWISICKK